MHGWHGVKGVAMWGPGSADKALVACGASVMLMKL